jgi:hypothetical protein
MIHVVNLSVVNLSFDHWLEGLVDSFCLGHGSRECPTCGNPCTSVGAQITFTGILVDWLCEDGHEFTQFRAFETLRKDYERADHTVLRENLNIGRKC